MYVVYILHCVDDSYYTGLSNDFEKRIWQHETGYFNECYTYKRRPLKLVWQKFLETFEDAEKLEKQIKGWSRAKKAALLNGNIEELKRLTNYNKDIREKTLHQAQGQTEFLIIGQGISGTFLSWFLHKEGKSFLVLDNNKANTASKVAAGIINPVSGRRMEKAWMIDTLIPFISEAYTALGKDLGITAISEKKIIDFFPSAQMQNAFKEKSREEPAFLLYTHNPADFTDYFKFRYGYGIIQPVFIAHLETILPVWRNQLVRMNRFREDDFDFSRLKVDPGKISYKDISAEKIIFCEGVAGRNNPFFQQLPFACNKGEALILEIPGLPPGLIYKKGIVVSPFLPRASDDKTNYGDTHSLFWAGTNYLRNYTDESPTIAFLKKTEKQLKDWLRLPFKILDHKAAIRPATLERRPFAGLHPQYRNVGILNGLGSKGCSLAPFFARQMVDLLLNNKEVLPEADITRFNMPFSLNILPEK